MQTRLCSKLLVCPKSEHPPDVRREIPVTLLPHPEIHRGRPNHTLHKCTLSKFISKTVILRTLVEDMLRRLHLTQWADAAGIVHQPQVVQSISKGPMARDHLSDMKWLTVKIHCRSIRMAVDSMCSTRKCLLLCRHNELFAPALRKQFQISRVSTSRAIYNLWAQNQAADGMVSQWAVQSI